MVGKHKLQLRLFFLIVFTISCFYASGQTPNLKWVNQIGGKGHQYGHSSTIDKYKNSYTAYMYLDEVSYIDASQNKVIHKPVAGYLSGAIAKYKPDGSLIFFHNIDGLTAQSSIRITTVAYDGDNSIMIIGTMSGSVNFATSGTPVTLTASVSQQAMYLAKYDLDGNLQWAVKSDCGEYDNLTDITFDNDKNIVLTGNFNTSSLDVDFTPAQHILTKVGTAQSAYIAKYSPSGSFIWAKTFKESIINKVITDTGNNIYFNGNMGANLSLGSGIFLSANGGYQDILFGKFDSNGTILWANNMGGNDKYKNTNSVSPFDVGFDIALDDQNNVIVTGCYGNTIDLDPSVGVFTFTTDETQTFLAKYTNAGKFIWAKGFNPCPGGRNAGYELEFDPLSKRIIVGGYFYVCTDFGTGVEGSSYQFTSKQSWYDNYIATFDYSGTLLNIVTIASEDDDTLTDMDMVDSEVLLTGYFYGTADFDFSCAQKNLISDQRDAFVLKYDYMNSPEANILSFKFTEQTSVATIDYVNHIIEVEVNQAADRKSLKPYITIPACATISPASEQIQDFTSIFEYLVTDKNGNKQIWKIVVNQDKSPSGERVTPTIISISPASAGAGSTVNIIGTNFNGATAVSFGGTPASSFTIVSSTSITAVVGQGQSGYISVITPGGIAIKTGFTFIPAPTIASFIPAIAATGATVTITGTNFSGATVVSFGSISATSFTVVSPTSITAVVGTGSSGIISVTTPGGTTTKTGFIFIPAPTITSLSSASAGLGSTVTIIGTNFTSATAVNFGGTPATSFSVISATSITAVVSTGTSGNISITTPGGIATLGGFTFVPKPTIIATGNTTFVAGGEVILTANPAIGFGYKWKKDGQDIATAITATYKATESGSYTVSLISGSYTSSSSDPVIVKAIYTMPSNNFSIQTNGETCRTSNNGSVIITAIKPLNYTAILSGNSTPVSYNFTTNLEIKNLQTGPYSICITVNGQPEYKQCYDISITEPKDLSVYSIISPSNILKLELAGGNLYQVELNGKVYSTTLKQIELQLVDGKNNLRVSTDKECQGVYEKTIFRSSSVILYPNPVENILTLILPETDIQKAGLEVFTLGGRSVLKGEYTSNNGIIELSLGNLEAGMYLLKLTTAKTESIFKVLKK